MGEFFNQVEGNNLEGIKLLKNFLLLMAIGCMAIFVGCGKDNDNGVQNGQPTIASISPASVSIGQQNAELTINGSNLNDTISVELGDGISVQQANATSASTLVVRYSVDGNAAPGPRTVIVNTGSGSVTNAAVFQVLNNTVPKVSFTSEPRSAGINQAVSFDASGTTDRNNNIASYHWEFGDGATTNGKKVKHTYRAAGTFALQLTVTDALQGFTTARRNFEVFRNKPPIAKFTVRPGTNGNTNTTFIFDASKSVDPAGVEAAKVKGYLWDFGDGSRKVRDRAVVEHQFKKEGRFFVSLTVFDNLGQEDSTDVTVKVEKSTERVCPGSGGGHTTIVKGVVVAVEADHWAIVNFGQGASCETLWHKCDDFRRLSPENFYGIVDKMTDRGNGILGVHNACPFRWPPQVGERVFVYYKTCAQNHCP